MADLKQVFIDFRPLDGVFSYNYIRPLLQSTENAIIWYIVLIGVIYLSEIKTKMSDNMTRVKSRLFKIRPQDCIFLCTKVKPLLYNIANAIQWYITLRYWLINNRDIGQNLCYWLIIVFEHYQYPCYSLHIYYKLLELFQGTPAVKVLLFKCHNINNYPPQLMMHKVIFRTQSKMYYLLSQS